MIQGKSTSQHNAVSHDVDTNNLSSDTEAPPLIQKNVHTHENIITIPCHNQISYLHSYTQDKNFYTNVTPTTKPLWQTER